ncbi:probable beta-1,4-xylosyltransferase IRX14 isoform X2 [Physcomitrium patens]|uniref:probable beta-1,4-xylosyltransferase IRX14 isoform X2 n=1 Tax=Physcomitrium patens TaxID=3218 RepID=UPI000D171CF9|nr:probable glucuronosyltransferase Os06g0687900 isoform X2 [Physcomitrium patens]|eukprot:XP_024402851.1 probable glucuronosyltransferase Os06g0687900 isoform X2 [Physcomitrella patens]
MKTKLRTISITDGGPPQQLNESRFKYVSACRIILQFVFCIASIILGFRTSEEISLVVFQFRHVEDALSFNWFDRGSRRVVGLTVAKGVSDLSLSGSSDSLVEPEEATFSSLPHLDARLPGPLAGSVKPTNWSTSTGVQVGRHKILIREWPHPDPVETMKAHNLIARVQLEQERLHGVPNWKPVIVITPTYDRMFQAVYLTGLMHTLSLVRGPVTWIVIEAGGKTSRTADLLAQARVDNVVHLEHSKSMPVYFESRWIMESHLRVEALRFVRKKKLEGVVVFADDSNVYSMEFFNLIQKVEWVGVLPLGVLGYAGFQDTSKKKRRRRGSLLLGVVHKGQVPPKLDLQVQTLTRNLDGALHGWHAHRPLPLDWDSGKGSTVLDDRLQWAGFVLNARAVWAPETVRPQWLKGWQDWARLEEGVYLDLRSIFNDETHVEPLAENNIVRHWWIRAEGRPDFKYPSRWAFDSQPQIVLPARSTPWREVDTSGKSAARQEKSTPSV